MSIASCYPLGMDEPKNPGGRPKGKRYPKKLLVYATDQDVEWLHRLAEEWDQSDAGMVRKLIREEAKRRGWDKAV